MSQRLRTNTGSRLTLTALKNNMDASGDVIGRVKIGVVALAEAKRALAVVALIAFYLPKAFEGVAGRTMGIHRDTTQPDFGGFATYVCHKLTMKPRLDRRALLVRVRSPALPVFDCNGPAVMINP